MRYLALSYILSFGLIVAHTAWATSYTVDIVATVPGCGDGVLQVGEECDGENLGGARCETIGFVSGALSCSSACTFLTNSCSMVPVSTPTRSSATKVIPQVPDTNVVISGIAAPGMNVSLLKDGQIVATVPARPDGTFQITVSGLSGGVYRMQLVGTSVQYGTARSEVFITRVLTAATTKVATIVLPPTLRITQQELGTILTGITTPNSKIEFSSNGAIIASTQSDKLGIYRFTLPQDEVGTNQSISAVMTSIDGLISATSGPVALPLTDTLSAGEPHQNILCTITGDVNNDCTVSVVDFFLMRWRYVERLFTTTLDLNIDGKVDLIDFSIMAFNWTG